MTRTKYGNILCKYVVWTKAKIINGKNPLLYRKDPYGNQLYFPSYGKMSEQGWSIDHIIPQSKGGSDDIRNLQALKHTVNIEKGDTLIKKSRHNN